MQTFVRQGVSSISKSLFLSITRKTFNRLQAKLRPNPHLFTGLITIGLCFLLHLPSTAQLPFPIPTERNSAESNSQKSQSKVLNTFSSQLSTDWIWLDGRQLFQITSTRNLISERKQTVQENLEKIQRNYLTSDQIEPQVEVKTLNNLPVISINNQDLITITSLDMEVRAVDASSLTTDIQGIVSSALKRSRTERNPQYLKQQGIISAGILLFLLILNGLICLLQGRLNRSSKSNTVSSVDIRTRLPTLNSWDGLSSLFRQVLNICHISIWFAGLLICMDRFPYTRPIKIWILRSLSLPLTVSLVGVCTYFMVRLSWALINRFALALTVSPILTPIVSRRLQLRISTITRVVKGIAIPVWGSIGIIVILILFKVDVGPLLAGVGLIGVAISLASQGIIKDAINGFLVISEDQFGVGDVIKVGEFTGIVETLNLRITQIRNAEGQLITIPNSEIKIVANLSSEWSQVDLNIPIPYECHLDSMLDLIKDTAQKLADDPEWAPDILESPQLMGLDDFSHRGLLIKIWIKTQPLKQWAISRELRRRLKLAFDHAGIAIPVPQYSIEVNDRHHH